MHIPDGVRVMRLSHHRYLVGLEHGSALRHDRVSNYRERVVPGIVDRLIAGDVNRPLMLRNYFGRELGFLAGGCRH
jgi:hypothetical protein